MKKIIYRRPDGGVSVVNPSAGARLVSGVKIVVNGETSLREVDPPEPFDRFTRLLNAGGVFPVWAETEDAFLARVAAKDVPPGASSVQVVEESQIPSDRTFRDAWTAGAGKVDHDMAKCREIHRNRLRWARTPLLAALDIEYQRADENGDGVAKAVIAAKKQALRDVTKDPAIEEAKTPEALAAVVPAALS